MMVWCKNIHVFDVLEHYYPWFWCLGALISRFFMFWYVNILVLENSWKRSTISWTSVETVNIQSFIRSSETFWRNLWILISHFNYLNSFYDWGWFSWTGRKTSRTFCLKRNFSIMKLILEKSWTSAVWSYQQLWDSADVWNIKLQIN